jgi:signal transduction histidine kinase
MERATVHLIEMPWVSGLSWQSDEGHGTLGNASPYRIEVIDQDMTLTLFSSQEIPPTMLLHINLLTQLLGHFYQAKRRERRLREITRLQTIYETGSRLTHDLKNMLQSMLALTSIAQHQKENAQSILQRQLPVLSQRVELLLAKLKVPESNAEQHVLALSAWCDTLRQRHQFQNIEWHCNEIGSNQEIPVPLFDSVADNLIDNACNKRLREPGITIRLSLGTSPLTLRVEDDGSAIPENIANQLLNTVVSSEDGFGVGLYQAARWASQCGYQLLLRDNEAGKVAFELIK